MGFDRLRNILPVLLAVAMLSGCEYLSNRVLHGDKILAEVGRNRFMLSQIEGINPDSLNADDSLLIAVQTENWVRRQIKLEQAERLFEKEKNDIDLMVREYRNTLLAHRLDQYYSDRLLDTLASDQQMESYFAQHRNEFILDRDIVKGRIVRVPERYRQMRKLRELFKSDKTEQQKDFSDICTKNNFEVHDFSSWVDFNEFLSYLPIRRSNDYSYMLSKREMQEMSDDDNVYLIRIDDYLGKGANAPLERAQEMVRKILYNKRRGEMIKIYEDSIFRAALDAREAKIRFEMPVAPVTDTLPTESGESAAESVGPDAFNNDSMTVPDASTEVMSPAVEEATEAEAQIPPDSLAVANSDQ